MNWRRGLFRLWIVGSVLFVIAVASVSSSEIKAEFEAVVTKTKVQRLSSFAEFRLRYPQYDDLSDAQLADALPRKFYSDMPREQFDKKIEQPGMFDDLISKQPGMVAVRVPAMSLLNFRTEHLRKKRSGPCGQGLGQTQNFGRHWRCGQVSPSAFRWWC